MNTITKSQLIDLYNSRDKSQLSEPIKPMLKNHYDKKDSYIFTLHEDEFEHLIRNFNEGQMTLITQWGIIEPEPKFKDGDFIMYKNEIIKITIDEYGDIYRSEYDFSSYLFDKNSQEYHQSRLATPEEIEANTLIQPIKGEYMNHKFYGVIKVHVVDNTMNRFYLISKSGDIIKVFFGGTLHKEMTKATPEQIYSFNRPWNEGIEEARKYKDGQPCLVSDCDGGWNRWELRYANGKGHFYSFGKRHSTDFINFSYHMPLNEQTIKNLPVNE